MLHDPLPESLHIITPTMVHLPFRTNKGKFHAFMNPDLYPVYQDSGFIQKSSHKITATTVFEEVATSSKSVLVDYRVVDDLKKKYPDNPQHKHDLLIKLLKTLRSGFDEVILFDTKDSHNIIPEFLPEVDLYYKKQLLRNQDLYQNQTDWLEGRVYANMIVPGGGMDPVLLEDNPGKFEGADKLKLLWNIATANNHLYIPSKWDFIRTYLFGYSQRIFQPTNGQTGQKMGTGEQERIPKRLYDLNGSFSLKYKSKWVTEHRNKMLKVLQSLGEKLKVFTDKLPKADYDKMLINSKAVVSPFGWGEVCYRDFEALQAGAILIKPDMSHLQTIPDIYKPYETYIPLSWDTDLWSDQILEALS